MTIKSTERKLHNLIKKIAQGKKGGLEEFYNLYGNMMFTTAMSICFSKDKAYEAVNSVLIKIWNKAEELREQKITEGWIYTVTVNCAKDLLKEKTWFELDENVVATTTDELQKIIDEDAFLFLIGGLSEEEQKLMIYKFQLDLTFERIANIEDKPLTTITSTYYRALEKIKKNLENFKNFE